MSKTFIKTIAIVALAFGFSVWQAGVSAANLTVEASKDSMQVDYNYHGSVLNLSGIMDKGTDLVLTVASDESHQKLKQKSKVGGILWMNTGDVSFEHVPNVYYLLSTKKAADILSAEELSRNDLGYGAIFERASIEATQEEGDKKTLFDEFVKYKERNKLFSVSDGGFDLSDEGSAQKYSTTIKWPFQIPPGEYMITAHAVKDGKVVDQVSTNVTVERTGVVKSLTDMAQNNGAIYGILAIVIALAAGFGVGLIFGKGGGAH